MGTLEGVQRASPRPEGTNPWCLETRCPHSVEEKLSLDTRGWAGTSPTPQRRMGLQH